MPFEYPREFAPIRRNIEEAKGIQTVMWSNNTIAGVKSCYGSPALCSLVDLERACLFLPPIHFHTWWSQHLFFVLGNSNNAGPPSNNKPGWRRDYSQRKSGSAQQSLCECVFYFPCPASDSMVCVVPSRLIPECFGYSSTVMTYNVAASRLEH